jgi:hypothetical protein
VTQRDPKPEMGFDYGNIFMFKEHADEANRLYKQHMDHETKDERQNNKLIYMIDKSYLSKDVVPVGSK